MQPALLIFLSLLSANEIMQRVAENQDRAQNQRLNFVYDQRMRSDIRFSNGKLAAEEVADYSVTPAEKGVARKETAFKGRYFKKGLYQEVDVKPKEEGGLDPSLAGSMRESFFDKDAKDGLGKDLFPLTTEQQKDLEFELKGEENFAGRKAYRIRFRPKDSHQITWAGEAVIDEEDFQPVTVYTRLSRRLPVGVRVLLGTDLPGLGFNVRYRRLDKDIWFPDSFGAEFRLHAVFFLNRTITISLENKNFQRTSAESEIRYGASDPPTKP